MQLGELRGAPAALAGDDLETLLVVRRPHQDRLQNAFFLDRIGQLFELARIEKAPWLEAVRLKECNRKHPRFGATVCRLDIRGRRLGLALAQKR